MEKEGRFRIEYNQISDPKSVTDFNLKIINKTEKKLCPVEDAYTRYPLSRYNCGTVCFMYDFEGQTHNFSALFYFCVELILSCTGVINTSYLAIKNLI